MRLIIPNNQYLKLSDDRYLLLAGYYKRSAVTATANKESTYGLTSALSNVAESLVKGSISRYSESNAISKVVNALFGVNSLAEAITEVLTVTPDYIPLQPTSLRVIRDASNENQLTLTWVDGFDTVRVEIYEATDQRGVMTKIDEVAVETQTYVRTTPSLTTNKYQLKPIGLTGKKGKASFIVYSAPTNNIL